MNKTHLNIARKKRDLGWTYKNITAFLQAKGARTRKGANLYTEYVYNELKSSALGRSRIEDRAKQKKRIATLIKKCKSQNPPLNWFWITKTVNNDGFRNMRGGEFSLGNLQLIWRQVQGGKKKARAPKK